MPLLQQQLAFAPVQLGCEPALACPFYGPQGVVQTGQGLFNLPRQLSHDLAPKAV
jgi:hypothetical protein